MQQVVLMSSGLFYLYLLRHLLAVLASEIRPKFYRIHKKKSTEGFHSLLYVASLFSAMLWIFYAFIKTNEYLLITINTFGCIIQTICIVTYLTYAPWKAKIHTLVDFSRC